MKEIENLSGFYRVHLEQGGLKKPYIVYALSDDQAVEKALDDALADLPSARLHDIEGPYHSAVTALWAYN